MKKNPVIWAGMLAAAVALGGCQGGAADGETVVFSTVAETQATASAAETAAEAEAIRQVEGLDAFGNLPVALGAPEGAENVEYYVIDGNVAEVNFVLGGNHYSFRGGPGEADVSGIYEELSAEALTAAGADLTAEIRTTAGGGRLATWFDGTASYSLYTSAAVEDEDIQGLTAELVTISEAGATGRQQVENREGLSALGIPMAEPEDAEDMVYYIIGGSTAEIRFAWDDCSFAFRGAAGSVDPGTEENWSAETTELRLEYEGGDLVLTCQQAESGARLATWSSGDFAYSLYAQGPLENEDWEEICSQAADTTKVG